MRLVRFAFVCDRCGERGEEYAPMAWCVECGDDVCFACSAREVDAESGLVECARCAAIGGATSSATAEGTIGVAAVPDSVAPPFAEPRG